MPSSKLSAKARVKALHDLLYYGVLPLESDFTETSHLTKLWDEQGDGGKKQAFLDAASADAGATADRILALFPTPADRTRVLRQVAERHYRSIVLAVHDED